MRAEIQVQGYTLIVKNLSSKSKEELVDKLNEAQALSCGKDAELYFDLAQWKLALDTEVPFVWGMFNKTITIG